MSNVSPHKHMDDKVLISLLSVAMGWLLGQGTALVREWWSARRLKVGLITELQDIDAQLQRVILMHTRHLQIFAIKGIEPAASIPIPNMFFQQYFKNAFHYLNREQRMSYQLIHGTLESLNKKHENIIQFLETFYKEHRTSPDETKTEAAADVWGDQVIAAYKTAMNVRWHIKHHLNNISAPAYDIMGPMHESYVKFEHDLDIEVKTIIKSASTLKREDFERIYDPKLFARGKSAG